MKTSVAFSTVIGVLALASACEKNPQAQPRAQSDSGSRSTPATPVPTASIQREAAEQVQALKDSYWLKDGDSWFTRFQLTDEKDILYLEAKGLDYTYTPNQATEADRLNGIEWQGQAVARLGPTRTYSPRGTMMHWESHPAGWTAWKDQPFMNASFEIRKVNGRWTAQSSEHATMTKPNALDVHKITQRLTSEDQQQVAADAAKLRELRELSRKETRIIGTYDATNFVLSNAKHFKVTLTDVGVRIDNYYTMNGATKGPVSLIYGQLKEINTWNGNPFTVSLQEPQESYSLSFRDANTGTAFLQALERARSAWKQKFKSVDDSGASNR